jgi:hypothetical protein
MMMMIKMMMMMMMMMMMVIYDVYSAHHEVVNECECLLLCLEHGVGVGELGQAGQRRDRDVAVLVHHQP